MSTQVNEKSPFYMTVAFKDELDAPFVPTTVDWRLDNFETGTEIVPWTVFATPAASIVVIVPGANNNIQDETKIREERAFGIRVDNGLVGEAYQEFHYHVINLIGATGP